MELIIRPAVKADGPALGRFGAALASLHHAFDADRFMLPDRIEPGYRRWLLREAQNPEAVVLVAERGGTPVGYAYGTMEPRDWNMLREACGAFHDLWVDESVRGGGVGGRLAEELVRRLRALGAPRVVLMTAVKNGAAQRLFARLGWRPTMVEMTREL